MVDKFIEGMTYISLEHVSPHREKGDVKLALKGTTSSRIRYESNLKKRGNVNSVDHPSWALYSPTLKRI